MPSKRAGRPHVSAITDALVQAAERVMATEGFSGLTVDGLVNEIGTTRPTFYRRFPNVAHLAFEVIKTRFGSGANVDTGSLYEDLLTLQREEIAMFASPLFRNSLPGLLEAARTEPAVRELYEAHFLGPRRSNVERVIEAAVARGEIDRHDVDIEFVCDMLVGPVLSRALLPVGAPLDDRLARQTAQSVLAHLRIRSSLGR